MFPFGILRMPAVIAALRIVAATLPNGDRLQSTFEETPSGVRAVVVTRDVRTGVPRSRETLVKPAPYSWRIDEEKRTIIMAPPGRPTGVVSRVFILSGWLDTSGHPSLPPKPAEIFRFYTSSRKGAEELRERLKKALRAKR